MRAFNQIDNILQHYNDLTLDEIGTLIGDLNSMYEKKLHEEYTDTVEKFTKVWWELYQLNVKVFYKDIPLTQAEAFEFKTADGLPIEDNYS